MPDTEILAQIARLEKLAQPFRKIKTYDAAIYDAVTLTAQLHNWPANEPERAHMTPAPMRGFNYHAVAVAGRYEIIQSPKPRRAKIKTCSAAAKRRLRTELNNVYYRKLRKSKKIRACSLFCQNQRYRTPLLP